MRLRIALQKRFEGFDLEADFSTSSARLGIFGPSGSGKSTLVGLLAGLEEPDAGLIELDGEPLYCSKRRISVPSEKRRISVVFQHAHLFPHMSARRNLLYGYRRTPAAARRIDPADLVGVLELEPLLGRDVTTLSGGERQRVALGRAVLASPRLLLMDEPLSALDEGLKYQIIPYLRAVFERFGIPLVFISHSMNEMRLMSDEVIVLRRGRVAARTTPEELARSSMGRSRAGYTNLLKASEPQAGDGAFLYRWGQNRLITSDGGTTPEALFELSSREIMLFKRHPEAISARNLFGCRIVELFDLDGRVGVELECGGERLVVQVVKEAATELGLQPGGEVHAAIKASSLRKVY